MWWVLCVQRSASNRKLGNDCVCGVSLLGIKNACRVGNEGGNMERFLTSEMQI